MGMIESRLQRIELEVRFREWVRDKRAFEAMNVEELETFAVTGKWPDRPEPGPGTSPLDTMDRASLIKLWKEDQQLFAGRNPEELESYAIHGHWPEQKCGPDCGKLAIRQLEK